MSMKDLRKMLKEEKNVVFGAKATLKNLKRGITKKIFLAKNCDDKTRGTIEKYAKMVDAKVVKLKEPNEELALICKRQHLVSVVSC